MRPVYALINLILIIVVSIAIYFLNTPTMNFFKSDNKGQSEYNYGTWDSEIDEYEIVKSEDEWKEILTEDQYKILREAGTEKPFTSELNDVKQKGVFYSAASLQPVYSSEAKFESGTGWPSFYEPISDDAVVYKEDRSWLGIKRIEILDSKSGSHLGHVFPDGPAPTGQRYCMNGDALIFVPEGKTIEEVVPERFE